MFTPEVGDLHSLDGSSLSLTTSIGRISRDLFDAPVEREETDALAMAGNSTPWNSTIESSGCTPILRDTVEPCESILLPHQGGSPITRGGDATTSTKSGTGAQSGSIPLGSPAREISDICKRALDCRLKDATHITDSHEPEVLQYLYRLEKKVDCVDEKLDRLLRHFCVPGEAGTDQIVLSSDGRHVMMENDQFDYDTADDCSLASYVTV